MILLKSNQFYIVLVLLGAVVLGPSAFAQESKAEVLDEALMARMKDYATPSENHQVLNLLTGSWEATIRSWVGPLDEPQVTQAKVESQWILGGRFVQQKFEGAFKGQSYEGLGILGYDNIRKEYQSLWADNMGTGMAISWSLYDPTGKTFSENGEASCPITGQLRTFRGQTVLIDNDHYTQEIFMEDPANKEFKTLEITYTRIK